MIDTVLLDMDGTLLKGRFIENLARRTNKCDDVNELLDRSDIPAADRTRRIAALFAGIPKEVFEEVAKQRFGHNPSPNLGC